LFQATLARYHHVMEKRNESTRREVMSLGIPALVGTAAATLGANTSHAAEAATDATPASSPKKPWPEQRKEIERKWLDLLGDFPTDILDSKVKMKKVAGWDGRWSDRKTAYSFKIDPFHLTKNL
jgi:hypothetical protein